MARGKMALSGVKGQAEVVGEQTLFGRFAPRIRLYGLRHLGSEQAAGDLVQVVLMRVIEALREGRVNDLDNLGAYVLGTCRYAVFDLRRGEKRQRAIELESEAISEHVLPPDVTEGEVLRLMGCLQKLPERDNRIVRMSFMEDRSTDEIAQRLQLTSGNVRVLRHRALARLYECVERGGSA
jgi:RNA polymerase sigma-70 factor (ECF subfamily)